MFINRVTRNARLLANVLKPIYSNNISKLSLCASTKDNISTRVKLAAAYRGLCMYDIHEGVCNHLSALTKSAFASVEEKNGRDMLLLIPYGRHWSKVTAGCLVGMDVETSEILERANLTDGIETAAMDIHRGVYLGNRENDKVRSVMHVHPKYATTLACLEDPTILPVHQNSARFFEDAAYDTNYAGFADCLDEGARLCKVLGEKHTLMMINHGVMTTGPSVAEAFDRVYYLERACMFQVTAFMTGRAVSLMPPEVAALTREQSITDSKMLADGHLNAIMEKLRHEQPEFENVSNLTDST